MYNPFNESSTFFIQILFDFYIFIVLLKIILQRVGADFYNPISQSIVKLTDAPINIMRRYLPMWQDFDMAAVGLAFVLELIKLLLVIVIKTAGFPDILGLLLWAIGDLLSQTINILFYSTLAIAIIGWFAPTMRSPIVGLLNQITDPLFKLTRQYVPPFKGLDLSALVILVGLELMTMLVIHPLFRVGIGRVFSKYITSVVPL